jgi:hypothetical protein
LERLVAIRLYLIVVFVFAELGAQAQLLDTSDVHNYKPIDVYRLSVDGIQALELDTTEVDTQLNLFYNYYPVYNTSFPNIDLGLEATPSLSLGGSKQREVAMQLGANHMENYFLDNSIHIYQTTRPFTRLEYAQGPLEFINVGVTHAQQISKRLAFGLDYRRIKNQNLYYSNLENLSRVRMGNLFNSKFYTSYYTPTRKYEMIASYVWNKSRNAEPGGLANDTTYELLSGRQKENNNPARYTSAFNTHAQNNFKLSQFYRPGGKSTDSTIDMSLGQFRNQFFLTTEFRSERLTYEDNNPDSANYGFWLDEFKDSFQLRTLSNEVGYTVKLKPISLTTSLQHAYCTVYNNGIAESYNNVYARANIKLQVKSFGVTGNAKLGLLGYNLGDYHLDGNASFLFKGFNMNAGIISQLVEPNYLDQNLNSNVISWTTNFKKTSVNKIVANAAFENGGHRIKARANIETIGNLVYFDNTDRIQQESGLISLLQLEAGHGYKTKYFGSNVSVLLQNSSNNQALPRPATSLSANAYVAFRLFNKNLGVQVGARSYWFSDFNSPMYTPYTRQWHNTNENFTMTAPINPYVTAKAKSFFFGFEMFHVQEGLMGDAYYSSPDYALMPRSVRLNFRWDLSN